MNGTIPWEITQRKGRMTLICTASTYRFVQHNNCNHNTLFDCTIEIEIIQKDGKICLQSFGLLSIHVRNKILHSAKIEDKDTFHSCEEFYELVSNPHSTVLHSEFLHS